MIAFILRRVVLIIPLLFLISVISFVIILLPPGSYVETYVRNLEETGYVIDEGQIEALYRQYGLNRHPVVQWLHEFICRRGYQRRCFHARVFFLVGPLLPKPRQRKRLIVRQKRNTAS